MKKVIDRRLIFSNFNPSNRNKEVLPNVNNLNNITKQKQNSIPATHIQSLPNNPIPSGLLAIYKPSGISSAAILNSIKFIFLNGLQIKLGTGRYKMKIGHGGTLDPMAEGVLVVGIGKGTKLLDKYLSCSKEYLAIAKLGSETDTLDSTGIITETVDYSHVTNNQLIESLIPFRGNFMQLPPIYSALKVNGKKMCDLARQGIEVIPKLREVTVYSLNLENRNNNNEVLILPKFGLKIECKGGFYVRSLISDIGRGCNTRAHMTNLIRTKQGLFSLDDCLYENDWTFDNLCQHIIKSTSKL
jgi:tRNA pseudouridine55 synthase